MNKLDHFLALTCSFAYSPYKRYSMKENPYILTSKEKITGKIIGLSYYGLLITILGVSTFKNPDIFSIGLFLLILSIIGIGYKLTNKSYLGYGQSKRKEKMPLEVETGVQTQFENQNELSLTKVFTATKK